MADVIFKRKAFHQYVLMYCFLITCTVTPPFCSIGSKCEYEFEQDVNHVFGVKPHTFDPFLNATQMAIMSNLNFLHYYPIGLAGSAVMGKLKKSRPQTKFVTLNQLLDLTKIDYIDILKVDCEGCEYPVIDDLFQLYGKNRSPPFGQLCIEIHT